jgi:hypothetical protein
MGSRHVTVEEARKQLGSLEKDVDRLLAEFEGKTGLRVTSIYISRVSVATMADPFASILNPCAITIS